MKLDKFLYEAIKPEANKSDPYGEYLFAPQRTDVPVPKEGNTREEELLYYALLDMFQGNDQKSLKKYSQKILNLLNQNKYTTLLSSGDIKVYRGMVISRERLSGLIKPYGEEIKYNKYVTMNLPNKLKPSKGKLLQSWSTNVNRAADFSDSRGGLHGIPPGETVSIIFAARTYAEGNNFFGAPGKLARVVASSFASEKETISVGPVEYDGFAYFIGSSGGKYASGSLAKAAKKVA
jgi:hypothetical protein